MRQYRDSENTDIPESNCKFNEAVAHQIYQQTITPIMMIKRQKLIAIAIKQNQTEDHHSYDQRKTVTTSIRNDSSDTIELLFTNWLLTVDEVLLTHSYCMHWTAHTSPCRKLYSFCSASSSKTKATMPWAIHRPWYSCWTVSCLHYTTDAVCLRRLQHLQANGNWCAWMRSVVVHSVLKGVAVHCDSCFHWVSLIVNEIFIQECGKVGNKLFVNSVSNRGSYQQVCILWTA